MQKRLGALLREKGLVSSDQINEAINEQINGNHRLGHILIRMGAISEEQLLTVLSQQLDAPIITLVEQVERSVKKVLPRSLCQKYNVVPLRREEHNTLQVAMVDPSDAAAIADIEEYTGLTVRPLLARANDVSMAIKRFIPFSARDLFTPWGYGRLAKVATAVVLLLIMVTGGIVYRTLMHARYGTISQVNGSTTYKNHDLMLGLEENGTISLLGRGAKAKGLFSVSFPGVREAKTFVELKRANFSAEQAEWLLWVIDNRLAVAK